MSAEDDDRDDRDWDELNRQEERRRRLSLRRTREAITAALLNIDGLQRLRDLTDEEWQAAVDADDSDNEGS